MKALFRAWDKRHNEMVFIDDLYWFEENGIHSFEDGKSQTGDYEFMRPIGITDKNNKDIFEEDVVELTYKLYPKKKPVTCVVVWLDYKACFRAIKSDNFIANIGNKDKYSTKIIGNTKQNPEYAKGFGYTAWYPLNQKQKEFAQRAAKK